jgi:hypothetical protein
MNLEENYPNDPIEDLPDPNINAPSLNSARITVGASPSGIESLVRSVNITSQSVGNDSLSDSLANFRISTSNPNQNQQNGHYSNVLGERINRSHTPLLDVENIPNKSSPKKRTSLADEPPTDPNEPVYCLCQQVSWGNMIGCDNYNCAREWFHYSCVGLTAPPKGKWYCKECKDKLKIS